MNKPIRRRSGFTLIELLVVIGIISILSGMLFVSWGPISNMLNRRTAEAQVQAMTTALNEYAIDNGSEPSFPEMPIPTEDFDPTSEFYMNVSRGLFKELTGRTRFDERPTGTNYYNALNVKMVGDPSEDSWFMDPWRNAYGYTTDAEYNEDSYDLWSTGGLKEDKPGRLKRWITNWADGAVALSEADAEK